MITVDATKAEEILGHPLGRRQSDDKLAMAAVLGHLGRPRGSTGGGSGSLSQGVDQVIRGRQNLWARARRLFGAGPAPRLMRTWRLPRSWQLDQNGTPQCVAYTEEHWRLSLPMVGRARLGPAEMYRRAKLIDGWPGQDGTDASAMLAVCTELGIVESHWWWQSEPDTAAADEWLLNVGPMWLGAWWSESMFRTTAKGMIEVTGELKYGHETLVLGTNRRQKMRLIQNSWGRSNFGVDGRGWIRDEDFNRLMAEGGDLIGVVEKRAA